MIKKFLILFSFMAVYSQKTETSGSLLAIDASASKLEYDYKLFLDSVKLAYQNYVIKRPQFSLNYQPIFHFNPVMIKRYSALESQTVPREFLLGEEAISGVYRRNFVGINFLAIIPLALQWANVKLPMFGSYIDPFTAELIEEEAWQEQIRRDIAKEELEKSGD